MENATNPNVLRETEEKVQTQNPAEEYQRMHAQTEAHSPYNSALNATYNSVTQEKPRATPTGSSGMYTPQN